MLKCKRLLKENLSSYVSILLILLVIIYKVFYDERHIDAAPRRRSQFRATIGNVSRQSAAVRFPQKSFVQVWNPSYFWKLIYSIPVRKRYDSRRMRLERACEGSVKTKSWLDDVQLITAPKRRLVVCYVQKAGSTSWQKLVYNLRHPEGHWIKTGHMENRIYAKNIDWRTKVELMTDPKTTRIICVRHPFSRLISGWNNKFHRRFMERSENKMMKTMRGISRYVGRSSTEDQQHAISFRDFVEYIVDHGLDEVDNHFKSIEQLCAPCSFPYNFVVKAETSPEDLWWVLHRFNGSMASFPVHSVPEFKGTKAFYKRTGFESWRRPYHKISKGYIVETIRERFQSLPRPLVEKVMELYRKDFDYFGYTFDIDTSTAGGLA